MRVHPLVTVKKAASLLGTDKRTIRAKLRAGELKGELRRVGVKDKWFVYSGEMDFLIENQRLPELQARAERTSTEGMNPLFDDAQELGSEDGINNSAIVSSEASARQEEESTITELVPTAMDRTQTGQLTMPFEQVLEIMTRHFSLRIGEEQNRVEELRRTVISQSITIAEIPSLQAKLNEEEEANRELRQELLRLETELNQLRKPAIKKFHDWLKKACGIA